MTNIDKMVGVFNKNSKETQQIYEVTKFVDAILATIDIPENLGPGSDYFYNMDDIIYNAIKTCHENTGSLVQANNTLFHNVIPEMVYLEMGRDNMPNGYWIALRFLYLMFARMDETIIGISIDKSDLRYHTRSMVSIGKDNLKDLPISKDISIYLDCIILWYIALEFKLLESGFDDDRDNKLSCLSFLFAMICCRRTMETRSYLSANTYKELVDYIVDAGKKYMEDNSVYRDWYSCFDGNVDYCREEFPDSEYSGAEVYY